MLGNGISGLLCKISVTLTRIHIHNLAAKPQVLEVNSRNYCPVEAVPDTSVQGVKCIYAMILS